MLRQEYLHRKNNYFNWAQILQTERLMSEKHTGHVTFRNRCLYGLRVPEEGIAPKMVKVVLKRSVCI